MDLNFKNPLFIRIASIAATAFLSAWFLAKKNPIYVSLILLFVTGFLIIDLLKFLSRSSGQLNSFFDSIKFDDISFSFKTSDPDPNAQDLQKKLNKAMQKLRELREEKDAEFQYMKNIIQYVGIGLITFKRDGNVQLCNTAFKKLLKLQQFKNISELETIDPRLSTAFKNLRTGGRELLRLNINGDIIQLAIYAIELNLRGEDIKLISIQNIQSELEEKEMEAWQNLVRVLTHEIMNSVTPISSLASIVEDELQQEIKKEGNNGIPKEQLNDMHLSLQTISRRSEGLISFIKEFRNLAQVPKPKLSTFKVKPLLEEIAMLHKKELSDKNIALEINVDPEGMELSADRAMIEQVLVNLVKNAIQAFDEELEKSIKLEAHFSEKGRAVIHVKDNGSGIEQEVLERIFIPFFTTKKTGSGIGLSLSRQIMRQHQGSISVKSEINKGTEFTLKF